MIEDGKKKIIPGDVFLMVTVDGFIFVGNNFRGLNKKSHIRGVQNQWP